MTKNVDQVMSPQHKLMPTEEMIEAGIAADDVAAEAQLAAPDYVSAIYLAMEAARPTTDVSTEHGPHCDVYSKACRQCLNDFAAWKRRDVSTDGLEERLAEFFEPDIMAKKGEQWAWRQDQERKLAHRALEESGILATIEALQRSNAEKDELLREASVYADGCFSGVGKSLSARINKALSHSSETSK